MLTGFMPIVGMVDFLLDGRCADRAGCSRTIYFKSLDGSALESPVYSLSLIYDPFPPRLIGASVRIDQGAVLGSEGNAEIYTEFDEPVLLSTFASLSGGSPQCLAQVEVVDGKLDGLDFPDGCAGTYSIELTATDLAGNSIRLFDAATLVVDRSPPPPIDLGVVTSSCANADEIILGGAGAAEASAVIDAAGERARADDRGAFVVRAEPGVASVLQIDAAGNQSAGRTVQVSPCGG
jgi:hypothetical protein